MKRYTVRETELIGEYFEAEQDDEGVSTTRTPEEDRAETERRRAARIALQAELEGEVDG